MNGIAELAKMLKDRDNSKEYTPFFGKIIELPKLKIAVGDKIILTDETVKSIVNIHTQDENGRYINIGKEVLLLPYSSNQKFVILGVII